MGLPIYKFLIKEDDNTGVSAVALVEDPATERTWQAFSKDDCIEDKHFKFQVENEEKRIVSGALMVANLPIFRRDEEIGEFYAMFDQETIEHIRDKFHSQGNGLNVNIEHMQDMFTDEVFMVESFIIDKARGINAPKGFDGLTDGSWFGSYKVTNDLIWEAVKDGTFNGFSVEGAFDMALAIDDLEEEQIEKIQTQIEGITAQMQDVENMTDEQIEALTSKVDEMHVTLSKLGKE